MSFQSTSNSGSGAKLSHYDFNFASMPSDPGSRSLGSSKSDNNKRKYAFEKNVILNSKINYVIFSNSAAGNFVKAIIYFRL